MSHQPHLVTRSEQGPEKDARALIIERFDLPFGVEYLKYKLGWDPRYAEKAIKEYRRFLRLAYNSPTEITPSEPVDEVWHIHILHTKSYAQLAEQCGKMLHHNPGMPNQAAKWNAQYALTLTQYEATFGEVAPVSHWPVQPSRANVEGSFGKALRVWRERGANKPIEH